ncbi:unnamed protein product [Meganyctiphanes norvegica]|uniref:Zinc finger CCCH domain-containing protein 13 n=1 Tax=Meganyctiphanes norvegica TaxID=48144 RepID=A0AAV2PYZ1_MEGNR
MVLKMALLLNTSAEETNTDCYFYYYATCSKDTACPFRHEPAAMNSQNTCNYWREGKCYKQICTYRHMDMEKKPSNMCWFESQPGGCQKQNCTYKHNQEKNYQEGGDGPNVPEYITNPASTHQEGANKDESANLNRQSNEPGYKLEAGEIAADKEKYPERESLLGNPPIGEKGNGVHKTLDPTIEVIRKRLMEPPGIERRVEEFIAAIRFSITPPQIQQPVLRKSLADRLTFKKDNNRPQTLTLNEMKNRINSLKTNQQQQQVLQKTAAMTNRGRGRGRRGTDNRNVGYGRGGMHLGSQDGWEKERELVEPEFQYNVGREYGIGRGNVGEGRGSGSSATEEIAYPKGTIYGRGQDSENSIRGRLGGFTGGERGTGYMELGHEKKSLADDMIGLCDVSMGQGKVQEPPHSSPKGAPSKEMVAPTEEKSKGVSGKGPVPAPYMDAPQDKSASPQDDKSAALPHSIEAQDSQSHTIQQLSDSKLQDDNGIIDDKKIEPQPEDEKQVLSGNLCNKNKPSEIPDPNLSNEKKPLLEPPQKVEVEVEVKVKVKVEEGEKEKEKKTLLELPQKVEDKKKVLPVKDEIFSLIQSARLGPPSSDKDPQPTSIKDPKPSNKPDRVENKKDDTLPKTVGDKTHLGIGHTQNLTKTQSTRRDIPESMPQYLNQGDQWHQEDRQNERLNWNSEDRWYDDRRDLMHRSPDRYMAQGSSVRTGYDRRWSPGRDGSYDYNHRNDSFKDRGNLDEYRHNYDQDWDSIDGPSQDWRFNRSYNPDWEAERGIDARSSSRVWDDRRHRSPSRDRGILGAAPGDEEGILGMHPKDSFDRFSDKISAKKKDWDYDRDPEFREWGPLGKTKEALHEVGLRDHWNESYSQKQPWDPNAGKLPRDWSPSRLPERENIRNWGSGSVSETYRSSERDIRGKDLTPIRSPEREDSYRRRLDDRSPFIGQFTRDQPSPGRRALSRGRSPLSSSEVRSRSPSRSFSHKISPTITPSKTERSSPNSSGRNPTGESSTPVSAYGQHKNKTHMAICVKNLPIWTDEESLKNVLTFDYNKYGLVTGVDVTGTATERFAVVHFRKPHEAQDALYDSTNKVIFGQNVTVSLFDGELPLEESKVHTVKSDYDYNKLLVGYKGEELEALRSVLEVHKRECQKYREMPSSHPQYNEEYHIFCIDKQSKILSLGGDPTQYDILPEWKAYWPRRLEELFAVSWQNMKKQCLGSLTNKKEITSSKKSSSTSSKRSRRSPSPSPRIDKASRRKHKSSYSKSHSSTSRHREKSRSRRRRSSSRSSTESSSTPKRDKQKDRHHDKHKKSRRKRERSSSHSSSSTERSETKSKTTKKKEKKELPSEDPMEDGEIRDDDVESDVSRLTSTKKNDKDTQKDNYQEFIKQRMSDVLGHIPERESNTSTKISDKNEKSGKKKSKFPNEIYPYTLDGTPKVKKNDRENSENKMSRLVPYEAEDDQEQSSSKRRNLGGGGALGALMAQYSEPGLQSSSGGATVSDHSHQASNIAISPLKVCGNIIHIIDILSVSDETISSVSQPLKDLYKQAMAVESRGSDPTEVFKDGKATVNLTSCKLAILAESGTISKSNRKLYQEAQENIDKLMKVDQQFVEGINIERISKKTMEMDVSEAIQLIRKELLNSNPSANVGEDRVMNLYMEIKKRHLMYSMQNYHDN